MTAQILEIRRPPANAKAADPCQRTTTPRDAGRRDQSPPAGRGTYPSRAGLITAICVSWTIAVVAGVLIWSI